MTLAAKSCAACANAHLVDMGLAGVGLECRALPPLQDVAKFARSPMVREDHYCTTLFERRPEGDAGETQ